MPDKTSDHEIRTRIDSFLAELSGLVRKAALEAAGEALGEGPPRRRRGPGRPRGSGRRGPGRPRNSRAGKRVRRSAADLEKIAARVLAHVKSNAGHRLEQIGKALKTDSAVLKRPIANLLATKKLRTKGRKRGTMYFAGGGRGASKSPRKARTQRRRKAKGARKAKAGRRAPRKKAARRAKPVIVRPVRNQRAKPSRKPSRAARASKARGVINELEMQAAAISTALP